MVRMRAFGMYSYKITDAKKFYTEISGTRDLYTRDELEEQLRNLVIAAMTTAMGGSSVPFLDMAANQGLLAEKMKQDMAPVFERYGVTMENFAVENVSLPEELQKAIDTRISMGMMGDMAKYTQYQVATSIPLAAQNEGGIAGVGASLGAGLAMAQTMAESLRAATGGAAPAAAPVDAGACRRSGRATGKTAGAARAQADLAARVRDREGRNSEEAGRLRHMHRGGAGCASRAGTPHARAAFA